MTNTTKAEKTSRQSGQSLLLSVAHKKFSSMAIHHDESTIQENGYVVARNNDNNDNNDDNNNNNNQREEDQQRVVQIDVNDLRRQRHETFREVGFTEVAEHKAVNGYSSILIAQSTRSVETDTTTALEDSYLKTPLIDISNLGGNSSSSSSSNYNNNHNGDDVQHSQRQQQQQTLLGLLSPEAGLHRDGEQARLVEVVRRRQMQQQQQQYYEESTLLWLEETAAQFWESILVYGGMMEDPRPQHRIGNPHPTLPENPYRDNSRSLSNDAKPNHGQTASTSSSSDSETKTENHPPTSSSHPIMDGPPPSSRSSSSLSLHRRILRTFFHTILRIMYAFRWSVDSCIARLADLDPLLPHGTSSLSTYSTSPVYSLRVTADDILLSLVFLWVFFYCIFWMQSFALPVALMTCLCVGSLSRKVVGRALSLGNQHPIQLLQQRNENQSITMKNCTISTIQPKFVTPKTSIPINDREGSIQRLQTQIPNATLAECKRFFKCVKFKEEAAFKRIDEFFKWRSECGLNIIVEAEGYAAVKENAQQTVKKDRVFDRVFAKKDEEDWIAAAKMAISIVTKSPIAQSDALPQIICSYEEKLEKEHIGTDNKPHQNEQSSPSPPPRCKDKTRIFHIFPARIDLSLAAAPIYSLAAALYLDGRLCRSTTERCSLVVDVRGGNGWSNPTPWSILPFVQSTASLLGSHYPERLERLVLFPMPKSAIWVWRAAEKLLDPDTSSKVVVVSSGKDSALPERLTEFFAEESLNVLEKRRRSFFAGSS